MLFISFFFLIAISLYAVGLGGYWLLFFEKDYGALNRQWLEAGLEPFVPYGTVEGFYIAIVSIIIAVVITIYLFNKTDLIYPTEIYRLKLIAKRIEFKLERSGTGVIPWHLFDFEDENGSAITIIGTEKMYCFILPGNIVDVSLKNMRLVDFELYQVSEEEGGFQVE